uniref:Glyco_hydro_35 domain-containing protein n=1 Tax=Macrostomum lignano TaxID=282301 RepID=A0A1I8FB29_9PLAT
ARLHCANLISKLLAPMRASLSLHMFHGGTNFGFMASRLVATSHDWDAPVHEVRAVGTQLKYRAVAGGRSTATPWQPETDRTAREGDEPKRNYLGSLADPKLYESAKFMEEVDQNFGFIVYRSAFKAGQVVTVDGYVADWGLPYPGNTIEQQQVQQQQPAQRHLSLKRSQLAAPTNTLDLIVENLGRSSSSSGAVRPKPTLSAKGLASWQSLNAEQLQAPGRLLINEQPVPSYKIYSLRLDAAFMAKVAVRRSSWLSVSSAAALPRGQPGLYRASLRLMDEPLADTYLDMSAWRKGVAFVNGFNLGRYWTEAGPQRTLYLPPPLLRRGDNETTDQSEVLAQSLGAAQPAGASPSWRPCCRAAVICPLMHRLDWLGGSLRPESAAQQPGGARTAGPCN